MINIIVYYVQFIIKNENPYYCYKCQKIFHEKCLKEWDNKCKKENKILSCPNCRNELLIEKWNKKLDYENNRKNEANIMNKIYENKINNNIINMIKDKKIKKYEIYINKTFNIFKNILNKFNEINKVLKLNNNILNNIINNFQLNYENLEIENITNIFNDEFEKIYNYIKFQEKENEKLIEIKNNKKNNNEDNNKIYNNKISNNYIIGKIKIKKEDINKNIRIINSYDEFYRENNWNKDKDSYNYENEKEIKENIIIKINNRIIDFNYFYKFNSEKEYTIEYIFKII